MFWKLNILNRGNDLSEQFWPVFYYMKQHFLEDGEIPLWNNMWFSGTPLLPDPQFSLFYLPNLLFFVLPIDLGFPVIILAHIIFGACGIYYLARRCLNFSKVASFFALATYISSTRLAGYLEAGHYGLVLSVGWLPWLALTIVNVVKRPRFSAVIFLAFSYAGLFYTHTVNFIFAAVASLALLLFTIHYFKPNNISKVYLYFITGCILAFGLTAVIALPQIEWLPQTTRSLLLAERDVYPKWASVKEFFWAVFFPWKLGVWQIDTEKWLGFGSLVSILALIGFVYLNKKLKLVLVILALLLFFYVLNNASPIYNLLLSFDWYVLARVATRIWFLPSMIIIFLAAYGFDICLRKKRILTFTIGVLSIAELLWLSGTRLVKPVVTRENLAPIEVYEYIASDKDRFRVFCVDRCFAQNQVAKYGLEQIEGYNTIQQKNYFVQFIQLSQVYWDKYTLALPPMQIYKFRQIQPHAPDLADYNVKYVVSPHHLTDSRLQERAVFGKYIVYENSINKPRAYFSDNSPALITNYKPNRIIVDVSSRNTNTIVLSEVHNNNWKAYLNSKKETTIYEYQAARKVELEDDTQTVLFEYKPTSFRVGAIISLSTLLLLSAGLFRYTLACKGRKHTTRFKTHIPASLKILKRAWKSCLTNSFIM